MSYSVLRRYTPPTCALEILAKNSPLSRWAGQTVLKEVRFNLSLDDPKLPSEEWVTLRGDRAQLEALREAVQTYVQRLLEQSQDRLSATSPQLAAVSVAPEPGISLTNSAGVSLRPRGLLSHDLLLGSLQTETSGSTVQLTTLQLFDLANALDEYAVDVLTLPALPRSNWLVSSPAWAKIAAAALLLVGVSASIVKVLDAPYSPTTASSPNSSQGASSTDQRIATQLPQTAASPQPLATPKLLTPPPPPIGSTTPPAGVPTNPGLPTLAIPQNAPVTSEGANGQAESTIVVPAAPRGGQAERQPAAASGPVTIAEAPSPDQVDTSSSLGKAAPSAAATRLAQAAPPSSSAFDIIPQVAEAKNYFKRNWTPPKDLNQTLEYVVSVDAKGVVQSVSPLGGVAKTYLPQSGIPQVGEPLVSPLQGRTNANFRLVLSPDGSVLTFLAN